jgi:hypothetical protein
LRRSRLLLRLEQAPLLAPSPRPSGAIEGLCQFGVDLLHRSWVGLYLLRRPRWRQWGSPRFVCPHLNLNLEQGQPHRQADDDENRATFGCRD